MPLPLEEHVRQILLEDDRGQKLYEAVHSGWKAFGDKYPQRHTWRRKASSRHMVWEEIVRQLMIVAANDVGVAAIEHRDTLSLVLDDEVLLRLKHADTGLVTRNYPTDEAQDFDNHDVDLYGFSGLQRVKLCYVPDQFETELIWVGVAASNQGKFLWKIQLDGAGAVSAPEMLPLVQTDTDTAKLVRLKKDNADNGKNKKSDGR